MMGPRGLRSRVLSILALVMTMGFSVPGLSAAGAAIRLSKVSGPPATGTVVRGTGFGGAEPVDVRFDGTDVASTTTDGSGAFSARIKVPRSALPGDHIVKAVGRTTGASARATFTVRTDWTQFHFTPSLAGLNPYENVLKPSNVPQLNRAWVGTGMGGVVDFSSPAVVNGIAYVGDSFLGRLWTFNAAGCGGDECLPLWSGRTAGTHGIFSSPAVADGVVYIGIGTFLEAFDAAGCGRRTCGPMWIGSAEGTQAQMVSSAIVANGVVYIGENSMKVLAFKAAGCGAFVCFPLWQGMTDDSIVSSTPAVADGALYIGSGNRFFPDDQAGRLFVFALPQVLSRY